MAFPKIDFDCLPSVPLAQKSYLPRCSAIYFVLNQNKEILYVGRAINLLYRWRDHHRFMQLIELNKTQNISIFWWECQHQIHDLISAENYYINFFKPLLNSTTVPTIFKGNFSIVLSQLARNTIVAGLFSKNKSYELVLIYAWPKKNESRKIAQLLKKCLNGFTWTKNYIQKTPFWIGNFSDLQLQQPVNVRVTPCIIYGLFWRECTKSSIPTLVLGVPMRIVDWRTNYEVPNEENFLDVSILDRLIANP